MRKEVYITEMDGVLGIAVDSEFFDWELDEASLGIATRFAGDDTGTANRWLGSIQQSLVNCFSEFVGRKVTLKEINDAIEAGYIET